VDDWLVRRGFSILPELSEEELEEIAEVFRLLDDDDSGGGGELYKFANPVEDP
jgi:hypothetical protein